MRVFEDKRTVRQQHVQGFLLSMETSFCNGSMIFDFNSDHFWHNGETNVTAQDKSIRKKFGKKLSTVFEAEVMRVNKWPGEIQWL